MKRNILPALVSFLLTCCNVTENPCNDCGSTRAASAISGLYFRYLITSDGFRLIRHDSTTNESKTYPFCQFSGSDTIENNKILKVDGELLRSCNGAFELVQVKSSKIITTCVEPFIELNQQYDLINNLWITENIQFNGSYQPPCEGSSSIVFKADNSFNGSMTMNFIAGNFTLIAPNRIKLSDSIGIGLFVGTKKQSQFESIFVQVFSYGATIEFTLNKNHLMLRNMSNNSIMNLHTK